MPRILQSTSCWRLTVKKFAFDPSAIELPDFGLADHDLREANPEGRRVRQRLIIQIVAAEASQYPLGVGVFGAVRGDMGPRIRYDQPP